MSEQISWFQVFSIQLDRIRQKEKPIQPMNRYTVFIRMSLFNRNDIDGYGITNVLFYFFSDIFS